MDFRPLARSIDRILEVNKTLPEGSKIRVISASIGWMPNNTGYKQVVKAVEMAKKEGIFVVSSSVSDSYKADGMAFHGLGREPLLDPDDPASYSPGIFWQDSFFEKGGLGRAVARVQSPRDMLLIPMDSRCVASQAGVDDYVFYRTGGWSWSIPYIAGLYALACQVNPDITPQEFWTAALATGDSVTINKNEKQYILKKIVNPEKLLLTLSERKNTMKKSHR